MCSADPAPRRRPRRWLAATAVALTAAACVAALVFRGPLSGRYWAWQIARGAPTGRCEAYVRALCQAGPDARWGVAALLADQDACVRQFGVLILHHVHAPWAAEWLFDRLTDEDANVRLLAAAGLARRGDERVIPALKWNYRTGDAAAATDVGLAFELLGTPAAVTALGELSLERADSAHRAALVDALEGIGTPACVPPLLSLLSDQRVCPGPRRADELARGVLTALAAQGLVVAPTSAPASGPAAATVAERAAAALARITGVHVLFASADPAGRQAEARAQWAAWYAERRAAAEESSTLPPPPP